MKYLDVEFLSKICLSCQIIERETDLEKKHF